MSKVHSLAAFVAVFTCFAGTRCGGRDAGSTPKGQQAAAEEGASIGQPAAPVETPPQARGRIIDGFDTGGQVPRDRSRHQGYRFSALGYDVYYDKADVSLSRSGAGDGDSALSIGYDLPPFHDWGNWISVRREFDQPLDLTGCTGLKMDLRVMKPSGAKLRITLADIDSAGRDELWWFDFDGGVLAAGGDSWRTVMLPFDGFSESYGEGTRHNDDKLDLSGIIAYEVNVVSPAGARTKGAVALNELATY